MNNTYAIGDIHGELGKLTALIDLLPIDKSDTVVFLGDYIDRGSKSKEVIEYLIHFKKLFPGKSIFLMGNHEWMMIQHMMLKTKMSKYQWCANGGDKTIKSYGLEDKDFVLPSKHSLFFNSLKLYFEQDEFFFSHAGINYNKELEYQNIDDFVWTREFLEYEFCVYPEKTFVFGHTPEEEVKINLNKICIDTGACYGGKLTAIRANDNEIFEI